MKFKFLMSILTTIILSASVPIFNVSASNLSLQEMWIEEAASSTLNPSNLDKVIKRGNYNEYVNNFFGYSFQYPKQWGIDHHQVPVYTRFFTGDFRLDITYTDTSKINFTPERYIELTVNHLPSKTNMIDRKINGKKVVSVGYSRDYIEGIDNDLNNYRYFFIVNNPYVYTFQLKAGKDNIETMTEQVFKLISSFKIKKPNLRLVDGVKIPNQSKEINYVEEKYSLVIPSNKNVWGIYTHSNSIAEIEEKLGSKVGSQLLYYYLDSDPDTINTFHEKGKIPVVTLQFVSNRTPSNPIVKDIVNGKYDDHIRQWALKLKETNAPVLLRLSNEMNGFWTLWSAKYTYNDPDLYKLAYRRVVDVFKESEATNVKFIWNPNNISEPYFSWNDAALYYPGDKYVDWIGLTGYNYGKTVWKNFQSFDEIYSSLYTSYMRSFPNKPMIITEFASSENGGDKAKFISDAFKNIPTKYPNIKIAIWFNEEDAGYDFPIFHLKKRRVFY
ncbi:Beta-mannanase-like protein [Brevibacillus agri BAB-2500]|nr:Beta-mannanase-like protein [Brevibacillus agri BAB-2500]